MFERRLKILLILPILAGFAILTRLFQIQLLHGADYVQQAEEALVSGKQFLPPLRGRILDRFGRVLVSDEPAHDAAVHYGVLSMSPAYLMLVADHLRKTEPAWHDAADAEVKAEVERRIADMWLTLERISGAPLKEFRRRREAICGSVERLRRHIWQTRQQQGLAEPLERLRLQEEDIFHPILKDISPEVRTRIELELSRLPYIRVEPSVRRVWGEQAEAVCHVLGRLGPVSAETIDRDAKADDWLTAYRADDEAGISGVEALGEPMLRGKRGFEERYRDGRLRGHAPPIDGLDVQLTVDLELQQRIARILTEAVAETPPATGACCVVIDVPSREILALVSIPTYDRDTLRARFDTLRDDAVRLPLLFRAVQGEYQPGSIIKPVTLLAGFATGTADALRTVNCTGQYKPGSNKWHCWTYWRNLPGHGYVAAEEAIQRSCNVYFFDLGERLGAQRLTDFFRRFVQGAVGAVAQPPSAVTCGTGLIEERFGLIPSPDWVKTNRNRSFRPADGRNYAIGQGEIQLTPLQAANIFATVAAGSLRRPTIIANDMRERPDLAIPGVLPAAWELTRRGLYRCVNEEGGTAYNFVRMNNLQVCGKTGSAQCVGRVVQRRYFFRQDDGEPQPGAAVPHGTSELSVAAATVDAAREMLGLPASAEPYKTEILARHPPADPSTGKVPTHAWFAGYASYRQPKIAVAVLIEYGGSGGHTAGPAAKRIFEALMESPRGYLGENGK
jgi:cell division protein FtsI/penicillin-binding protein 2